MGDWRQKFSCRWLFSAYVGSRSVLYISLQPFTRLPRVTLYVVAVWSSRSLIHLFPSISDVTLTRTVAEKAWFDGVELSWSLNVWKM